MPSDYSIEVCNKLRERFRDAGVHRPMRVKRYDAGQELTYEIVGVLNQNKARVRLVVEDFVGGGFAGQVYRVKVLDIEAANGPIGGLEAEKVYAMKVLVPPSGFSRLFRNALYWVGFQGPFQLQVNPAAARASALWQKLIRRAAAIRLGDERAVVDVHATFVDENLGSCGELSEWVDGRTWRLEVDDRLDLLKKWRRGKAVDETLLGSAEYRTKRRFMADFVRLLHEVGADELGRQYEWWTCKSQPNCLKRRDTHSNPSEGLVAVDFKAGLALLPFLPMSPGDFKLIAQGIRRGSLVQFDRGNVGKLEAFVQANEDGFADMRGLLNELKAAERTYRDSLADVTHNHIRLLYSRRLWSTILDSAATGWKVRNLADEACAQRLRNSKMPALLFGAIGFIPLLGKLIRRVWGRPDWTRHYADLFTNWDYLRRAVQARIAEKVIIWHRAGRVGASRAFEVAGANWRYFCHLPLSVLPAGLHRFLTDREYRKEKLHYIFVRPVRLYFNAALRERWLREMVTEGQKSHMLTDEDAAVILSQINEPFIQKYLKSLAVHLCTLPVTQIVSVALAITYVLMHPEMPRKQAWGIGAGIIALFQVVPISPGSLVRGLYVLYLVIRERNFKDYNIAVFLGFFKYVGYLAFPIQMTYHYPALARFMAAHWATGAVHIVPVFGERGALLEHWVFCLFYNWPLTIRRRMRKRAEMRSALEPRYWHVPFCALAAAGILGLVDFAYVSSDGQPPTLIDVWWLTVLISLFCGALVTLGCGGAALWKRIIGATVCGVLTGLLWTGATAGVSLGQMPITAALLARSSFWRMFIFAIITTIGALITELKLPEPRLR